MFAYLKGILTASDSTSVIIDVNGIGYIVFIPCHLGERLSTIGEPIQLYTAFVVREFSHTLYGFLNAHERDVFEVLLNITGVGPKLALSLIGHLPLPALQQAVIVQDLPTLCKVPGVGKKTAERLIVELRDKLAHLMTLEVESHQIHLPNDPKTQALQDAVLALVNLGYTQFTAQKAVKQSLKDLPEAADLGSVITLALKHIKSS